MVRRPHLNPLAGSTIALISSAIIFLCGLSAWIVWSWVAGDAQTGAAGRIGAVIAAISLVSGLGAIVVAGLTVRQQQIESRRQRHMETLHLVNQQYEAIFDDILQRRERDEPIEEETKRRIYNRYFTTMMTGFRYYELGFIPRQDFEEWTATLIDRLKDGACIVTGLPNKKRNEMLFRWKAFDAWGHGPRSEFRRYVEDVILAGHPIDSSKAVLLRFELAEGRGDEEHRRMLQDHRNELAEASKRVVRSVRIGD